MLPRGVLGLREVVLQLQPALTMSTVATGSFNSEVTNKHLTRFSITSNSSLKKESTSSLLKKTSLPLLLHLVYNIKYILDKQSPFSLR